MLSAREQKQLERARIMILKDRERRKNKYYVVKRTLADIAIAGFTIKLITTVAKIITLL